jgi:lipase chaperone LimK
MADDVLDYLTATDRPVEKDAEKKAKLDDLRSRLKGVTAERLALAKQLEAAQALPKKTKADQAIRDEAIHLVRDTAAANKYAWDKIRQEITDLGADPDAP